MPWLKDLNREQVEFWQRQLNQFTEEQFSDIEPLKADGDVGPKTRDRVRDVKYWLGYGKRWRDASVNRELRWRIEHPNGIRHGTKQEDTDRERVARGRERRRRHRERADDDNWAYCRGVTDLVIRIVDQKRPNTKITSRKRSETFGNPSSDHYIKNTRADAVDFARVNDQWLMDEIAKELGGPADVVDFQSFIITHNGRRFRVQIIAITHGTGPHLHVGVKRI